MARYKVRGTGQQVSLDKGNFKAKGGEGSIHIVDQTVYKICDPGKMIPEGKFQELAVLSHQKIINPMDVVLDSKNKPVGYTMKLVPGNAIPLAQILSKTYREREGVTPQIMAELVKQIAEAIRYIHSHPGYLQVDGNEFNYMITSNFGDVYLIDVNSFQTPHYPADAIMPSIRDWNCPQNASGSYIWSEMTDWYSFAIISFYMFTGIHPFKGRHPSYTDLKTAMMNQMKNGVSVLDAKSQFPQAAVYFPFELVVPGGQDGGFMQWYRAVFTQNKRLAPPITFQDVLGIVIKLKEIIGSNNFDIKELNDFADQIIGYYDHAGVSVVVTTNNLIVQNQIQKKPNAKFRIGFTTVLHTPVIAWLENDYVMMKNLNSAEDIRPTPMKAKELMAYDGRIYVLGDKDIFEIQYIEHNQSHLVATFKSVATIMPNATQLFQGVAFQNVFGSLFVSLFPESLHHRQIRISELEGQQIVDAKYERNVLMVLASDKASGQYTRYIFRFAKDWMKYDIRKVENIPALGLNFTVIDNGVCICLTEDEKIEIFSSQKDAGSIKSIDDPAIKADMRLCHAGAQVNFAHGHKLYSISVKK